MKLNHTCIYVFALLLPLFCGKAAAKTIELKSPNGEIKVSVNVAGKIEYSVYYGNDQILKEGVLQLDLGKEILGVNPFLRNQKRSSINEEITREIPIKNAVVKNRCEVLLLNFKNDYSVEFRAYNDGVAYRFITKKKGEIQVKGETFSVNFPEEM